MARIIKTTVYDVAELDEAAKTNAREWYRTNVINSDGCWYEAVLDDFEAICGILGIRVQRRPGPRTRPGRERPAQRCIWFSGFSSQGDGASFEGTWEHAPGSCSKIREHAPRDEKLHAIADALTAVQKPNFYELRAVITHQGRYYHEYCMQLEVERDSERDQDPTDGSHEAVTAQMRELARWLYRTLQAEYESETSDTAVDEALTANEWMFKANGAFFAA